MSATEISKAIHPQEWRRHFDPFCGGSWHLAFYISILLVRKFYSPSNPSIIEHASFYSEYIGHYSEYVAITVSMSKFLLHALNLVSPINHRYCLSRPITNNGYSRYLNWRIEYKVIFVIFQGVPIHRLKSYRLKIYGRYLQQINSWIGHCHI